MHWNSGIANLAFVLLVEGGTHPRGATSNNVPAIGNFDTSRDGARHLLRRQRQLPDAVLELRGGPQLHGGGRPVALRRDRGGRGARGLGRGRRARRRRRPAPGGGCSDTNIWVGTASSSSPNLYTPNCSASGTFNGVLSCDNGAADLDLYLQKQSCSGWFGCSFGNVASSTSAGCDEAVQGYSGSSGTYRWRINWYSGPAEPFHLCTNKC